MSIIQQKVTNHARRQENTWSEETKQLSEPGSDMSQILEVLHGKKFKITMINILKVSMKNVNKKLSNMNREIETIETLSMNF